MFARVTRVNPVIEQGRVYRTDLFDVTVLETTADRQDILSARFDFRHKLSGNGVLFLYYNGEGISPFDFAQQTSEDWFLLGDSSDLFKEM